MYLLIMAIVLLIICAITRLCFPSKSAHGNVEPILNVDISRTPTCMKGWGPVRFGAQSGLGPSPGWGPVRVGARSGLGPIWAHMGPYVSFQK